MFLSRLELLHNFFVQFNGIRLKTLFIAPLQNQPHIKKSFIVSRSTFDLFKGELIDVAYATVWCIVYKAYRHIHPPWNGYKKETESKNMIVHYFYSSTKTTTKKQ